MSLAAAEGSAFTGTQTRYRARRLERFVAIVDEIIAAKGHAEVIDLGGATEYWLDLEPVWAGRPIRFTLVNLQAERNQDPRFVSVAGNACDLPQFADGAFDVVHSNSVIEHVGRWPQMKAFAATVRRLAPRHFVQTPNYGFPLEPHFRVPFFHWLPEPVRIAILRRRACGAFPRAETLDDAMRFLEDSILIDATRLSALFPDSQIERERLFGLTKSLMAIR